MVKPKKHLGQHFLKDEGVSKRISDALTGYGNYNFIIEIGPGTGALTKYLLKRKEEVVCLEVDQESIHFLNQQYPNLKVLEQDFLKVDIEGSEYEILNEIIFFKKKILGIVIEFHGVDKKINLIINFLKKINFKISHIHINNYTSKGKNNIPKTIEVSLEKHPKVFRFKPSIPHKLDQKNNPYKDEEKLNFI